MATPEPVFHADVAVTEFADRGCGVVASTDLPADTVVAVELPVAWCIDEQYEADFCGTCADGLDGTRAGKTCDTCGVGAGVCDGCDNLHTAEECAVFAKVEEFIASDDLDASDTWKVSDLRALARLLYRLRKAAGPADAENPHAVWALSTQCCTDAEKMAFRDAATGVAARASGYTAEELALLAGIVETNCYSIFAKAWYRPGGAYEPEHEHVTAEPIGIAVYVDLSRFNHSCAPNLTKIPTGLRMECVALRGIPGGEELCHSYVNPAVSAGRRRDELLHSWGFMCACPRCENAADMWALRALCSCSGYLIQDPDDAEAAVCYACGEWTEVEPE